MLTKWNYAIYKEGFVRVDGSIEDEQRVEEEYGEIVATDDEPIYL